MCIQLLYTMCIKCVYDVLGMCTYVNQYDSYCLYNPAYYHLL